MLRWLPFPVITCVDIFAHLVASMLRAITEMAVKRDSSLARDELEGQACNPVKRQRSQAADENDSCDAASPLGPWMPPPGYIPPWERETPWAPSPDADGNVDLEVLKRPFYLNGEPFIFETVCPSCVPEDECRHAEALNEEGGHRSSTSANSQCWQAHLSTDEVQVFSTWTAVPSPYLQRLEWVTARVPEPDFNEKLEHAFEASECRQIVRTYRYGAEVAAEWKRGSTPEEVRQAYKARIQAELREAVKNLDDGTEDHNRYMEHRAKCIAEIKAQRGLKEGRKTPLSIVRQAEHQARRFIGFVETPVYSPASGTPTLHGRRPAVD